MFPPIDDNSLSFEHRLIDDTDFSRKCFDAIMSDYYDGLSYMDHPKFMALG